MKRDWFIHYVLIPLGFCLALVLALGITQYISDSGDKKTIISQQDEIHELRKILARCLRPGDNTLTIGNEVWFCTASRTWIKLYRSKP